MTERHRWQEAAPDTGRRGRMGAARPVHHHGPVALSPFAILERDAPRRAIFGLLLVAVVAGMWFVTQQGGSDGGGPTRDRAIEAIFPADGSTVLRQAEVGIDLVEGYRASLSANGVAIPEDEITGIPEGDHQPALARYAFSPAEGKVIETWQTGRNCVTATYWPAASGRGLSTTYTWCFTAA